MKTVRVQQAGSIIETRVAAADDPANPYVSSYQAWDRWALDNLQDFDEPGSMQAVEGVHNILVAIDENGFMLPALEREKRNQDALAGRAGAVDTDNLRYTDARGMLDSAVWEEYHAALDDLVAQYYPAVPDWLVEAPPVRARLLPNGNVATYGALGSGTLDQPASKHAAHAGEAHPSAPEPDHGHDWYYLTQHLYDPQGTLIGESKLCVTPILEELPGRPLETGGGLNLTKLGLAYFLNEESGQITSVWDYDGTYLGTELPAVEKPRQPFSTLEGWQLAKLHAAQQRGAK